MDGIETIAEYSETGLGLQRWFRLVSGLLTVIEKKRGEFESETEFTLSDIRPKYATLRMKNKALQSYVVLGGLIGFCIAFTLLMVTFKLDAVSGVSAFVIFMLISFGSCMLVSETKYAIFSFNSGSQAFAVGKQGKEIEKYDKFIATVVSEIEKVNYSQSA